ncbi:MAG: FtsW/RodA/SpoVE family cell cycle protein [Clostridia bacterium]|nr:FtsW/RodA/SpoVE family cell cycle protein [Clostridia bacterium]
MNNKLKNALTGTDFLLYIGCILASAFGCLMVYSATRNEAIESGFIIGRECLIMIFAAGAGIIACAIISIIDYNSIIRIWPAVGAVCLVLLAALFVWGEGPADRPDAKCWLPIIETGNTKVYFQPSELAKAGFLITFSAHLNAVKRDINKLKNVIFLTIHALIPMGIIILTDDLGSALIFGFMFIGMMFVAGLKVRYFALAGGAIVAVAPILWSKFLSSFHRQRILAVYYPEALSESVYKARIYQQQRAVNAIGSGGLLGDGLFKGKYTQSASGIPVNESDMVFSVVGEELGFLGGFLLLLALALICLRIMYIGRQSSNLTGAAICYGTAFMLGSQIFMNIGMCIKLLPCIGITLPFISAGGSSNLCVYFTIGLVMSVYRINKQKDPVNFRYTGLNTPFEE